VRERERARRFESRLVLVADEISPVIISLSSRGKCISGTRESPRRCLTIRGAYKYSPPSCEAAHQSERSRFRAQNIVVICFRYVLRTLPENRDYCARNKDLAL